MRAAVPLSILAATAAFATLSTQASATPPPGYTLEWSEQFNQGVGSSPNPATWGYVTGGGGFGNNELETYVSDSAHSHLIASLLHRAKHIGVLGRPSFWTATYR